MITLSKKQILMLHEQLIRETGGSFGLRDEGMLNSALAWVLSCMGNVVHLLHLRVDIAF